MENILLICAFVIALSGSTFTMADVLKLKDGQKLTGTLVSRDTNGVVFDIAGQQLTFTSDSVESISFGDVKIHDTKPVTDNSVPSQKTQATKKDKIAPVGTRIVVRTNTSINSRQHKAGHRFNARLEGDIVVDGIVIVKRSTTLYGVIEAAKSSGRLVGKSQLSITFTDIMINNQMLPISTSSVKAVTEGTGKKTVGSTARIAAIGGLINGSKGAKDGAKVGLGLSVLSSGNSINIPAGTMLEFQLATPLTVK